ncbi:uncharacterized protein A4U43_C06F2280 [Asparagus officinalis]|uniref:Uncharacterized protein n=1 Tax=Asparagus officinalis TaxID=4686 RepID=A0A5P1EJI4_ASPOF|nr:uncharacterized protein A4U43_C06F2280 [Asparagus officinalis]
MPSPLQRREHPPLSRPPQQRRFSEVHGFSCQVKVKELGERGSRGGGAEVGEEEVEGEEVRRGGEEVEEEEGVGEGGEAEGGLEEARGREGEGEEGCDSEYHWSRESRSNEWCRRSSGGSTQQTGSSAEEQDQALSRASLSRILRSFINNTMATPPPLLVDIGCNDEEEEYLRKALSAAEAISSGLRPMITDCSGGALQCCWEFMVMTGVSNLHGC